MNDGRNKDLAFTGSKLNRAVNYLGGVCLCLFSSIALAQDWVHLGGPPLGWVQADLESTPHFTPIQFVGTLNPPQILMNGQELTLTEWVEAESPNLSAGLWINQQRIPSSGKNGMFFYSLYPKETDDRSVEIRIRRTQGPTLRAQVSLNHLFFEVPVKKSYFFREADESRESAQIRWSGTVGKTTTIQMEGASIQLNGADQATIDLHVPPTGEIPGIKKVLAAQVILKDQTKRIINVPITLRRKSYSDASPVLSLNPERFRIEGLTNPTADLFIDDNQVATDSDGEFSFELKSGEYPRIFRFKVILSNGKTYDYTYEAICEECQVKAPLTDGLRRKSAIFLGLPVSSSTFFVPRDSKATDELYRSGIAPGTNGIDFKPSLALGWHLRPNLIIESEYQYLGGLEDGEEQQYLLIERMHLFSAGLSFKPVPALGLSAGMMFLRAQVDTAPTSPLFNSDLSHSSHQTLGLRFSINLRYRWFKNIEWVPRLSFSPAQLSIRFDDDSLKWHRFSFEPISLRFYPFDWLLPREALK